MHMLIGYTYNISGRIEEKLSGEGKLVPGIGGW